MSDSSFFIPVILGTSRQGRQSEHVAKFLVEQVAERDRLETELIDISWWYKGNPKPFTCDAGVGANDYFLRPQL
ncbi:hypothetical protein [Nostoc sp.]